MRHVRSRTCGGTGRPEPQWVRASQPLRRHRCRIPSYDRRLQPASTMSAPPGGRRGATNHESIAQGSGVSLSAARRRRQGTGQGRAAPRAGNRQAQVRPRRCMFQNRIYSAAPSAGEHVAWPGPGVCACMACRAPAGRPVRRALLKTAARPPPWHQAAGQLRDLEQDNTYGDGTMAARETLFAPAKACVSGTAGTMVAPDSIRGHGAPGLSGQALAQGTEPRPPAADCAPCGHAHCCNPSPPGVRDEYRQRLTAPRSDTGPAPLSAHLPA